MSKLRDPILILILLLNLALGASILTRGSEWGDDFASYIMQAQSILNGDMDEFIERNTFTIFESSFQIGPVAYPWGFPLALIPALLFKGVHALALKLPGLFFFVGFLICLYLLAETRLTRTERLLLVSLFAFNPTLVGFLDYILSDIPFLFSIFFGLLLITRIDSKQAMWVHAFLGMSIFFSFFIRTTGVLLLAGFLAYQALLYYQERTKRRAIALNSIAVVVTFTVFWLISSLIFPNGQGAYIYQLMGFTMEKFQGNIVNYFYLFVQFFDPNVSPAWTYIYYALVAFFLIGAWKRRNTDQMLIIFFAVYFGVMIIWPEWQGVRFIFPLLPIFVYFALQGMNALVKVIPERHRILGKGTVSVFWLILAGIFLFNSGARAIGNMKDDRKINGPFDPFSSDMFNYIRAETPPESVIVFFKPRALRLFTNRDSIMVLECENLLKGNYFAQHKKWEYSQI
ncbi:MAG TPA: hypothetical protein VLA72_06435, partial [Anaerolineales bacterium]|nr:hypothetical protein [Anaerolineales bacterium]